jgi:cholesterol transport system auxiliary component
MNRTRNLVLLVLPAVLLGGCVKFGAKPPDMLLTVTSTARVAPGTVAQGTAGTVTIIEPDVPKTLNTVRVAVRADDDSIAYVPKAVWADFPRQLFRALLAETVAARNGVLVLDPGQYSADPGRRVMGDLIEFGIDARTHQAVVTFDAGVLERDGTIIKRRFSATAPVSRIDQESVAGPIGNAANQVAADVADWLKATP